MMGMRTPQTRIAIVRKNHRRRVRKVRKATASSPEEQGMFKKITLSDRRT